MISNASLKKWKSLATTEQWRELAFRASTTVGTMDHLVTGNRKASSAMAIRIERASDRMAGMPTLNRTELSDTCGSCDYARKCRKEGK